jgi:hypothetical protein
VPHLAAGAHLGLVVEVQVRVLHRGGPGRAGARSEQVDHRRGGRAHADVAEGEVEDAAQVVLELRGLAGFDGVVARVVGAWGELVHQYLTGRGQEHLDAGHPDALGRAGRGEGYLPGAGAGVGRDRRRRDDLVADVVALDRLDHRVAGLAAAGRAGDHRRQLVLEADHGLHQHALAGVEPGHGLARLGLVDAGGVSVAVVAEPARLHHQGPAEVAARRGQLARVLHHQEGRGGQARPPQQLLLEGLVLHPRQGGRVGTHRGARRLDRGQGSRVDELVLERHHAHGRAQRAHRAGVAPVALHHAGGHRGGRLVAPAEHRHP